MNDTVLTVLITVAAVHLFNFIIFIIIENLDKRIIKSFDFYDFGSMFTVDRVLDCVCNPLQGLPFNLLEGQGVEPA